jgi:alkylation response protein AidB-like acyl-CoA dehydrogenase
MHEITVDYLKQRKQFGVPIGNFQVLQHRAGDMLIALGTGALDGDARHHDERGGKCRRAAQGDLGRQGAGSAARPGSSARARSSCMAASA